MPRPVALRTRRALPPSRRQYALVSPALQLVRAARGVQGSKFPNFIEPLLATERCRAPSGPDWLHEVKYDGYRLQLHRQEALIRCFTRRGYDWARRFRPLTQALWMLNTHAAILDGEVVVHDAEGHTDFSALESYVSSRQPDRDEAKLVFYAFDLLHLDGYDLRNVPLVARKQALKLLLEGLEKQAPIRYSEHITGDGPTIFRNACGIGIEGLVSKRGQSVYRSGRQEAWSKVICRHRETFVIAGLAFQGRKFDGVYLAREEGGDLVYAGKVESGIKDDQAKHLQALAARLGARQPPFRPDRAFPKAKWLKPTLLADVEYRARTSRGGLLRHPSYKGLRQDLMS